LLCVIVGSGESKDAVKPDTATEAMDDASTVTDTKPDIKAPESDTTKSDTPAPAAAAASETAADH